MADLSGLHDALALALRDPDPAEAVRVVCRALVQELPVDGAAISTMHDTRHRETVCASDHVAAGLEELQFTLGEGPCFDAFFTGVPVLVPDLGTTEAPSWPIYASRVLEQLPARAVFVFPVRFASLRVGALSAYRVTPGPLDNDAASTAAELADTAALVLLGMQDPSGTLARLQREASAPGLGVRATGHDRVHIAAGMVAEQLHLSPDDAFDLLRAHAFAEGRLLIDVASDALARTLPLQTPPPAGPDR